MTSVFMHGISISFFFVCLFVCLIVLGGGESHLIFPAWMTNPSERYPAHVRTWGLNLLSHLKDFLRSGVSIDLNFKEERNPFELVYGWWFESEHNPRPSNREHNTNHQVKPPPPPPLHCFVFLIFTCLLTSQANWPQRYPYPTRS